MSEFPPPHDPSSQPPADPWRQPYASPWNAPGYAPPPMATGTDGFAIASLVLGIVPVCAGLLGLVFGIIALRRVRTSGQKGRRLAIAGIGSSVVWIVIIVVVVVVAALGQAHRDSSGAITSAGSISVTDLRAGDCIADLHEGGNVTDVSVVPCSRAHQGEVYQSFTLADGSYPGDDVVDEQVRRTCTASLDAYVGTRVGTSHYDNFVYQPTAASWDRDRGVACVLTAPGRTPLYGSAAGRGPRPGSTPDAQLPPGSVTGDVAPGELRVGNCVTDPFTTKVVTTVGLGPCARPHYAEVFSVFALPASAYPGDDEVQTLVVGHCRKYLPGFVGAPAGHTGYSLYYYHPSQEDWAAGDRSATCLLEDPQHRRLLTEAKGHGQHR